MSNAITMQIDKYTELVVKHRWLIIIPFCLCMVAGIAAVIVLPRTYESKTLILIEPQRVPSRFVESIVDSDDISQRVNTLREQIMSRTNLEAITEKFKIFDKPEHKNMFTEDKLKILRKRIIIGVSGGRRQRAFSVAYRDGNPERAMKIAGALTSSFIDINLKVRETKAVGTSQFLEGQLKEMEENLLEVENALKDYRREYMGELPEQLSTNLRMLERIHTTLNTRQEGLRDARNRLAQLESDLEGRLLQLRTQAENRGQGAPSQNGLRNTGADLSVQLEQLKNQLAGLLAKYTERHPDVVRMKKMVADMEKEIEKQMKSGMEEPESGSEAGPVSLEYRFMRRQLVEEADRQRMGIRREISDIERDIAELREEAGEYQEKINNTPKREQELISLRRNYENIKDSYNSMYDRKLEADIAVSMERKAKGEQFRVVDSAKLPQKPVSPNMKLIFMACTGLGLGIGLGIIFLMDFFDTSYRRPDEIEEEMGLPVIGSVQRVLHPKDRILKKINFFMSILSVFIAFFLFMVFTLLTMKGVEKTLSIAKKFI